MFNMHQLNYNYHLAGSIPDPDLNHARNRIFKKSNPTSGLEPRHVRLATSALKTEHAINRKHSSFNLTEYSQLVTRSTRHWQILEE